MRVLGEWLRRLQYLMHRRQREEELLREMQIHRSLMVEHKRFGNALRLREESRNVWGWDWLDHLLKDLNYGLRQLWKARGLTALSVLTLAIAIGGTTTFSGLMKAALFADLPVRNPGELQQVVWSLRSASELNRRGSSSFSYPVYRYVQAHSTGFSDVTCWSDAVFLNLRTGDDLFQVSTQFVSGNFFKAIGLETEIGRPISTQDDVAGAAPVSMLSHGAWEGFYGGDEGVIGRQISLNGSRFTVIGVLSNKELPRTPRERWESDVILPASSYATALFKTTDSASSQPSCRIIGRMRPEISHRRAQQESEQLIRQAFQEHPIMRQGQPIDTHGVFVGIRGLRTVDQLGSSLAPAPLLILLLIGALLAIVCSNIAGTMLARGATRRAEVATRLALGANRRRIVRQLLTESFLLAAIGGATGTVIAYAARNFLPWPFALDLPVLVIAAGVSCATGLIFGLTPALTSTRMDLTAVMRQGTPGALGRTFRNGNILIAVQVTLSILLLAAVGLQVRSLSRLMVSTNFEPEQVITVQAHPRSAGYSAEKIRLYFEDAVRRIEALPGVTSATASTGDAVFTLAAAGPPGRETAEIRAIADYVAPRFFETMRIPVLLGRDTAWTDRKGAALVVVVNETFARTVFPKDTPLGKTIRLRQGPAEIVGVVADSNNSVGDAFAFGQAATPAIYVPFQQQTDTWGSMVLSARVSTESSALISAIRRSVQNLDPDVVVDLAQTQASKTNVRIRESRLLLAILSVAALIGLIEVSFGLYGILSFFVGTRIPEIGLRIALGAQRSDVIRMVLRHAATWVGLGALAGLVATPALVRVLSNGGFVIGVIRIRDEFAIVGAAILLLAVALIAATSPALRASRAHPMEALRHN